MLQVCKRQFAGIGEIEGVWVPIVEIRRLAGLSRAQMAKAMHCHPGAIQKWEKRQRNWIAASARAWLLWLTYLQPDPIHGWLKAALGLAPDGKLPPEAAL